MNLESFSHTTRITATISNQRDYQTLQAFLFGAVGVVTLRGNDEMSIEWSLVDMANHAAEGELVSEQFLPEALENIQSTRCYLSLIEIIINDWRTVDAHYDHCAAEEIYNIVELLAAKRNEIRNKTKEEPYANARAMGFKGFESLCNKGFKQRQRYVRKPSQRAQKVL